MDGIGWLSHLSRVNLLEVIRDVFDELRCTLTIDVLGYQSTDNASVLECGESEVGLVWFSISYWRIPKI